MIGNRIEFVYYDYSDPNDSKKTREERLMTGLVVDAFTEVTGRTSGEAISLLGFGEGKINGTTESNRVYKVQCEKGYRTFVDIKAWQLCKILSFASQTNQEMLEEKIRINA